jgi:hypothetical protein
MNPAIDPKQLEVLIGSDVFKQAQAAADAKRIAAHRAAADALLAHEADITALEAASAAVDEARRKFEPVAATYRKASIALNEKESDLQSLAWSRDHVASRLRHEAARHLPAIVAATESALYFCAHEIRNSLSVQTSTERDWTGGARPRYSDNSTAVGAALAQLESLRELLDRLALEPMPAQEIVAALSTEAGRLIGLAKACGASIAHHLPAELRPGLFVEKPDRQGPYIIPPC